MSVTATADPLADSANILKQYIAGIRQKHEEFNKSVEAIVNRIGPQLIEKIGAGLEKNAHVSEKPMFSMNLNEIPGWEAAVAQVTKNSDKDWHKCQIGRLLPPLQKFVENVFKAAKTRARVSIEDYARSPLRISVTLTRYPKDGEQGDP